MNISTPIHSTFDIERIFDVAPSRVFAAWSAPDLKARWFVGPDGWKLVGRSLDFRVGGTETLRGAFASGGTSFFTAHYHLIEPASLLVFDYDMYVNDSYLSVSLVTVHFTPRSAGTSMVFTEQILFLDGEDGTNSRRRGWSDHVERLAKVLQP